MIFSGTFLWLRQTQALTKKILLVTLARQWLSTLICSLVIPIVVLALALGLPGLSSPSSKYGVGSPSPAQTLSDSIPNGAKLFFIQSPNAGDDVSKAIRDITAPLGNRARVELLQNERQLMEKCPTDMNGRTDCFAAVVFNDSPLSSTGDGQWNYTIRVSSSKSRSTFDVTEPSKATGNMFTPLQLAVDQAITNSTIVPDTYMFTRISQDQAKAIKRRASIDMILGGLGIVCFASMLSLVFHIVGMISSERESGMSQLIDVMAGGAASARVLSYVIAFDIIYFPTWVILGGIFSSLLLPTTNAGIPILWQVLTGWALTSGCVFGATFAVRYSAIYAVAALAGMAMFAMLLDSQAEPISALVAILFSAVFPSCSYIFVLNSLARYEKAGVAANIYAIPPTPGLAVHQANIGTLWACLCLTIVVFPLVAILIETFVHGISTRRRSFKTGSKAADSTTALEVTGLTKTYPPSIWRRMCCCCCGSFRRSFTAVDSLDFTSQKQQILCLLGINGSGKTTTMDLITGRQRPTSGSIRINASSSQIGFCPQKNIQWEQLTVLEHAAIWDQIKGGSATRAQLEQLVESCDLGLKINSQVGTLSGGQKRKVQLTCMLAGGSSVCLMDEVTTGMDPVSRRAIWNIVLAERSKRSIILTTHFLDECEVLADQVVVVSRGHLKCQGSPAELKNTYGGGYRVHVPQIENVPRSQYPSVVYQGQTVFNTPDSTSATHLLSSLEAAGLSDVLVTGPTIEDVFLKVANEPEELEKRNSNFSSKTDTAPLALVQDDEWSDGELSSGNRTNFFQQLGALTIKRVMIFRSNFWWYILAMVIPLAFSPAITSLLIVTDGIDTYPYVPPTCQSFEPSIFDEPWLVDLAQSGYTDSLGSGAMSMLVGPRSARDSMFHTVDKFPVGKRYDSQSFDSDFVFQDGFENFQRRVHDNASTVAPGALYMGDVSQKPTIAYNPELGYDTPVLMQNLWSQARSGVSIAVQLAFFSSSVPLDAGSGLIAAVLLAFLHTIYPAFFALYPAYEKLQNVRALQYSNRVRPGPLWISYTMIDMTIVIIIAALATLALSAHVENWYFAGYMFPVFWLYGVASMLWSYIISLYARSELAAFGFTFCTIMVAFILSVVGFSLGATNPNAGSPTLVLDAVSYSLGLLFPIMNLFRALAIGLNVWLVGCREFKLVADPGSINAYGGPIMLLVIQVVYLFPLLLWLDGQHSFAWPWKKTKQVTPEVSMPSTGQDIEMKTVRVEASSDDMLNIQHVTKSFGGKLAVDNVSLAMGDSSVLALLGPNGAGKTTLTNMMRGDMVPDMGSISVQGVGVQSDPQMAREHIGVCPQFDALDKLTARQQLQFYARIKGVKNIDRDVELVMKKVGLTPHASRLTHKLSGGNKRKLSLAIALLGNPKVLILDEPSSAMDAIAKREMWKMLSSITPGRSVLLTTHSMEEADELATRVAIMSKRILAIGTSQELRKRYSNVYDVHLVLGTAPGSTRGEMQNVESWVRDVFPEASFDAVNLGGQVRFVVPVGTGVSRDGRSTVRRLMETLEQHKTSLGLAHYTVGMGTLEMVFLNIMRESDVPEGEEKVRKPLWRW
ncbi:Putative AAA+ ATPase domain, ABC-2 type transporter, transmembrane domain, ABC transporter [Colletotrichum destructivum]|uniref:AAA+ ATPase domain, ABC-2 type transporter, transmembrane domain, ABC transporter n=1 Tax=Colletotrichum destructivum TaxID=34406 RepID=A0AAX4IT03_9PEZI|nr:Putative AAA+ ATPase domain, ABC-2 type transporter, transmembrane domain, ABC transporter [Colletotrichum destructivum]